MPEASEPASETARLGSYEIVRKLARGGMAEVYLARGGDKLVVLKKILPRYANNPRYVQLFLDEAKLAASLEHPHIVRTFDTGTIDGQYYFAMEYVHGQDVRSLLRRAERLGRPVPIALAVKIARDVAEALHYAHERRRADGTLLGVVHRDVSPSNILVSYDGVIKLADFGVAKASSSSVRTRTGTLKGKVGYMSPEQARGMALDRRSDIFSLGVVLWELVAIRRLFKTDNDLATIQAIINFTPPPLTNVRDECPPELAQIIERALHKDRETRYQSAEQLQMALEILGRVRPMRDLDDQITKYLGELFEVEIGMWREALSQGTTVTDFVISRITELTTPISTSGIEEEEDLADEDPEDEEHDHDDPAQPARVGEMEVERNDAGDDATVAGPPPVMIEAFDTSATQIDEPAFTSEVQTVQAPTTLLDEANTMATTTARPASSGEFPPTSEIEAALDAAPALPPATPPFGVAPLGTATPPAGMTAWEQIDLAPWRKWILIGAAAAAVLLVIVVIVAIVNASNEQAQPPPAPEPTALPSPPAATAPAPMPEQPPAPAPVHKPPPVPKKPAPLPVKRPGN